METTKNYLTRAAAKAAAIEEVEKRFAEMEKGGDND